MSPTVPDRTARQQAIDVGHSFAVQAPAGSGKTELLSLRFLRLLSTVDEPEEILAITFTRKAAAEMAHRILETLDWAAQLQGLQADLRTAQLDSDLARDRFTAATAVLDRSEARGWQLRDAPYRLRIQTIDSFNHLLTGRQPLHAQLGGNPAVSDDSTGAYRHAVTMTLDLLESDHPCADHIATLLRHFDNRLDLVEGLLIDLLQSRDQWLGALLRVRDDPEAERVALQEALRSLIEETLADLRPALLPYSTSLCDLARYAAANLSQSEPDASLSACLGLPALPDSHQEDLAVWQGLADLLLTADAQKPRWRARVDKRNGFPPGANPLEKERVQAQKAAFAELVGHLSTIPDLLPRLAYVRRLPLGHSPAQWRMLTALTELLPTLTAQLTVAFAERNEVDHCQVALSALAALGNETEPTDLALLLDYRLRHILVDEFQDTSSLQMTLLERLTAAWAPGDGRTLFVVGDGMQSCYAFRNANVGLFIRTRTQGLGAVELLALDLSANFRSSAGVVEWVNEVFPSAFPAQHDETRGAVPYTPAHPVHAPRVTDPVQTRIIRHPRDAKALGERAEADAVVEHVQRLRQQYPGEQIAILVRARNHLTQILQALRASGIPWQATEIDRLTSLPLVEDLVSLARALVNPADRLAWFAVLRAPWIGLDPADLVRVAQLASDAPVCRVLMETDLRSDTVLSEQARQRLAEVAPLIRYARHHVGRLPLSRVLQATWHLLRGPLLALSSADADASRRFFGLLRGAEEMQALPDLDAFETELRSQFVSAAGAADAVQIMTLHKAKGLEFDHVILPGLARAPRADAKALLVWHERINRHGESQLLLATRGKRGKQEDALYELLRHEQRERQRLEATRLMYIGVTRARHSALLLATLPEGDEDTPPPAPAEHSLLGTLWSALSRNPGTVPTEVVVQAAATAVGAEATPVALQRWAVPVPLTHEETGYLAPFLAPPLIESPEPTEAPTAEPVNDSLSRAAAVAGDLIHAALQARVEMGTHWTPAVLETWEPHWQRQLTPWVTGSDRAALLAQIRTALTQTLMAKELDWVFVPPTPGTPPWENACELALDNLDRDRVQTHRIDRLVRAPDGYLWIIDYKSSQPAPDEPADAFIQRQLSLHEAQLRRYRQLVLGLGVPPETLRTGLLLTALPALVPVD